MGMLLSRFRAVIFPRAGRMPSGGIASEPVVEPTPVDYDSGWGIEEKIEEKIEKEPQETEKTEDRLYYGLHWRKELNWRALGFEFVEDESDQEDEGAVSGLNGDDENLNFHA
jgi:tRNA-specific adenosine deaminase 3